MKPIVFHFDAESELSAAVAFYENHRAGLGLALQDEVESTVGMIRSDPGRWPHHRETDLQSCQLSRFPFRVYYLDLADQIWIAAIAHQKRRPGYWAHRQPESP